VLSRTFNLLQNLGDPMSTTMPLPDALPQPVKAPRPLPAWLREPLLHFVLLGGLLFAADHFLFVRSDDPRRIVLSAAADHELRQIFAASRGHEPIPEELAALRKAWLDNEVLYREGLALQVDKGDTAIRDRIIFKALSVVDANTKLPPYDDALLKSWFEARHDKYDEPSRFDFLEAAISGDSSEVTVRAFVAELNAGKKDGDAKAGLRVFTGRPRSNLVQSYGESFAKALESAPKNEWRAQETRDGWRAIRLEATTPGKAADYTALRGVVLQDWTDATMAAQRSAAVQALAAKYTVKIEAEAK
jgi:hypothetical protein